MCEFDVQIEASLSVEGFAACLASETILPRMMEQMCFQLSSLDERFGAILADVGSLASMCPLMTVQGLTSREFSLTLKSVQRFSLSTVFTGVFTKSGLFPVAGVLPKVTRKLIYLR